MLSVIILITNDVHLSVQSFAVPENIVTFFTQIIYTSSYFIINNGKIDIVLYNLYKHSRHRNLYYTTITSMKVFGLVCYFTYFGKIVKSSDAQFIPNLLGAFISIIVTVSIDYSLNEP